MASEGGAEAIGANPNLTFDAWFVATFLLAEEMVTKRRVGEGEHVRGQGEDDTPEGWTFLNFSSFVRTELDLFWQKVKVKFTQKVNFVS